MAEVRYEKDITALLVVDPYNDFISEGGKIWDRIRAVAEANDCVPHMLQILNAARQANFRVFYVPHRRYRPGDYETWKYIAPFRRQGGGGGVSNTEPGVASSVPNSSPSRARLSLPSIGAPAVSPTPIWICSSRNTASISSSSSVSSRIPASKQRSALPLSSATRSPWSRTRQRITRIRRCRPLWTSTSRTMPAPL